jgi:molybdopterin-guanine dinucleotide biosynthesis protein A
MREVTGVLLLGGLSRRFGSVKALAPLGEETLAERTWRLLGEAFPQCIAVGKAADQLGLPFPVQDDGTAIRAPLVGVVAGLRASPTDVSVFLPVDCPVMTADALRALGEACTDAAVPQTGSLPGAYARSALPVLEARFERGELELGEALGELDARIVPLDADLLQSVNTERELERLRSTVGAEPPPPQLSVG